MASTKLVCIKQKSPLCLQVPSVARRASTKQGIFYAAEMAKYKIKSGTARRQCRSLQSPWPFKHPTSCASPIGQVDLLMLLYHNSHKKKSQRVNVLPLDSCTLYRG